MTTRHTTPLQARRGDPRGQVLVLFALMLVVLLLVSALAVDYGGWLVAKRSYQNIGDAAALEGAQQLTRPLTASCTTGVTKNFCARQVAWESIKRQLNFTSLVPLTQAGISSSTPYTAEGGYTIWVASPPADAGSAYLGHVSGPGNVYVRIDHAATTFLSGIAGISRTVQAWSTAGRFPANFAVIGMCSPTSVTTNCLAGDANIKIDGTTSNLIVATGDVGTNRWVKSGGSSSGVALGSDSNAYMQLFDSCWNAGGNQCNLWGWNGAVNTSDVRSAIPLGAPVQDPTYAAPTINATTAPNQCRGTGTVQLASAQLLDGPSRAQSDQVADLPIQLAAAVLPKPPGTIHDAANVAVNGFVKSQATNAPLSGMVVSSNPGNNTANTSGTGAWSFTVNTSQSPYVFTATDPSGVYHTTDSASTNVSGAMAIPDILMQKNPVITGTVRDSVTNAILTGVTIGITGTYGPYSPSGATGTYTQIAGGAGNYIVTASKTGYATNSTPAFAISLDQTTGQGGVQSGDILLTLAPSSLTGTVTDAVTGLPIPNLTVTLTGTNSASTTTNTSGTYTFSSVLTGAGTIITLTGNLTGYANGSPSSPTNPTTQTLASGANTVSFALWPKGCDSSGNQGSWSCDYPSNGNCPAPTNVSAANVNCVFTQANAIRPGTYNNITLPNGTCAWLDPAGGATGLASGQSGGIYHIKGTVSIGNGSYLFGDGVTLVFDRNTNIDVGNSGGFVLNYGTVHNTASDRTTSCSNYSTAKAYNDGYYPCFRTVSNAACAAAVANCYDYAYAAWTTKGHLLWSGTQSPTYSDATVAKGSELGITFFLYCPSGTPQCGLGNNSRFKISTASMGYLFNGVLYGPGDDIQLGGGKDGQTAAGQIVGWTIEYHGGTAIQQNWYGDPVDGQPFLIEPVLGE